MKAQGRKNHQQAEPTGFSLYVRQHYSHGDPGETPKEILTTMHREEILGEKKAYIPLNLTHPE